MPAAGSPGMPKPQLNCRKSKSASVVVSFQRLAVAPAEYWWTMYPVVCDNGAGAGPTQTRGVAVS
jgi:hypothetical protein